MLRPINLEKRAAGPMGISPIIEIRQVGAVAPPREVDSGSPAFALKQTNRTNDDSYEAGHEEADRGLEEEDEPTGDDAEESTESGSCTADGGARVNFFA